jgi:hypothetical protein
MVEYKGAIGEIIARSVVEPHPFARFASNNPEPIVLDLVQRFQRFRLPTRSNKKHAVKSAFL